MAAVSAGLAAGLVAMAARFSSGKLRDYAQRAGHADELRVALLELADADADAYGRVLAAYREPKDDPDRAGHIAEALRDAADVPLRIAGIAAEVAERAAELAVLGNRNLIGDALTAVFAAEAAARSAAGLVRINVRAGKLSEELATQADAYVAAATDAVRRVGEVAG